MSAELSFSKPSCLLFATISLAKLRNKFALLLVDYDNSDGQPISGMGMESERKVL